MFLKNKKGSSFEKKKLILILKIKQCVIFKVKKKIGTKLSRMWIKLPLSSAKNDTRFA